MIARPWSLGSRSATRQITGGKMNPKTSLPHAEKPEKQSNCLKPTIPYALWRGVRELPIRRFRGPRRNPQAIF